MWNYRVGRNLYRMAGASRVYCEAADGNIYRFYVEDAGFEKVYNRERNDYSSSLDIRGILQ